MSTHTCRDGICPPVALARARASGRCLLLAALAVGAFAGGARATHPYGLSGQQCIKTLLGGNPQCTAGDVRVTSMSVVGTPQSCEPGTNTTVTLEATVISAIARYDIGLWINQKGTSALTDASSDCYHNALM